MTTPQSSAEKRPSGPGPVTVARLAADLAGGTTIQDVIEQARAMEHARPMPCRVVYLDYRGPRGDRKLSGEAADLIWSALRPMATPQSSEDSAGQTPDITVRDLAAELDQPLNEMAEWVTVACNSLGDRKVARWAPTTPVRDTVLTGYAADEIRQWVRQQAAAEQSQRLHCTSGDCTGCCGCSVVCTTHPCGERDPFRAYMDQGVPFRGAGHCTRTDAHAVHPGIDGTEHRTWYRCDGLPDPVSTVDRFNDALRSGNTDHRARCTTCGTGIWYQDCPTGGWWIHDVHPEDGHDAAPVQGSTDSRTTLLETAPEPYLDVRWRCLTTEPHAPHRGSVELEVDGTEHRTQYRCEGVRGLPLGMQPLTETPLLTDLASLLIRQDMELAGEGLRAGYERIRDYSIMEWAVKRAGHLFDNHQLWDYDLVTDEDHFPRCVSHRHLNRTLKDLIPDG